jgi:hypothetical protein
VTRSFTIAVGATPTLLAPPDWENPLALPFANQTTSFTVTAAMVSPLTSLIPYNSASPGTVTIPSGIATIGTVLLFGQVGAGFLTVVAGGGVTVAGPALTYGPNYVLQVVQTSLNNWVASIYSWNLPQFRGNPNAQPMLAAYGQITIANQTGAAVLIDTNPALVFGGNGVLLPVQGQTGSTFTKNYGNGPAELWYGIVASTVSSVQVTTGPSISAS